MKSPEGLTARKPDHQGPPLTLFFLIGALLFLGVSGLVGGAALAIDPTGAVYRLATSDLRGALFEDYRMPGLMLTALFGVFPLVVAYGLYYRRRWSRTGALAVGVGLAVWIVVQILMIGYHARPPLQAIYGTLGLLIVVLTLLPAVGEMTGKLAGGSRPHR